MHTLNDNELNILYILLTNSEKHAFIFENCETDFFEHKLHRDIFSKAKELFLQGLEVDNVSIYENIKKQEINKKLIEILTGTIAYSSMTKRYCQYLFNNHIEKLIQSASTKDDFEYIENLKNKYEFRDNNIKHISDDLEDFEERYHKKMETSLISGYTEIDEHIGSFMGGDYIALGGGTGSGKTMTALNIAKQLCMQDKNVLYCSLEMPLEQLQNRFVCMNKGLNAIKYRKQGFNIQEYAIYTEGLKELKDWNLFILTDYNLTAEKLKIYIQQKKKTGLDFVIIDYLGLVSGYNNKSLYEKSTIISRKIKILATEFNIPILVLVQLNRDLKNRQDKRPILSDIRESGAIEQDADFVLFAHRPSFYDPYIDKRKFELIIAKNRHGSSNEICELIFNPETQQIKGKDWNNV